MMSDSPNYPGFPVARGKAHEQSTREAHERIERDFTLHPPVSPEIGEKMDVVRSEFKLLAHFVVDHCPSSRERSSSITRLEEALFHAVASIARDESNLPKIGDTRPS